MKYIYDIKIANNNSIQYTVRNIKFALLQSEQLSVPMYTRIRCMVYKNHKFFVSFYYTS